MVGPDEGKVVSQRSGGPAIRRQIMPVQHIEGRCGMQFTHVIPNLADIQHMLHFRRLIVDEELMHTESVHFFDMILPCTVDGMDKRDLMSVMHMCSRQFQRMARHAADIGEKIGCEKENLHVCCSQEFVSSCCFCHARGSLPAEQCFYILDDAL